MGERDTEDSPPCERTMLLLPGSHRLQSLTFIYVQTITADLLTNQTGFVCYFSHFCCSESQNRSKCHLKLSCATFNKTFKAGQKLIVTPIQNLFCHSSFPDCNNARTLKLYNYTLYI